MWLQRNVQGAGVHFRLYYMSVLLVAEILEEKV